MSAEESLLKGVLMGHPLSMVRRRTVEIVDNRKQVREFLASRRARLRPEQVGLPAGSNRRVAGLRRSEVAVLADVSIEYYSKIERGNLAGASDPVLDAIARALRLDEAEREHLFDLARAASGPLRAVTRRASRQWTARHGLQLALDAITAGPAFVRNGRMDILATNALGRAFYDHVFDGPGRGNLARFNFLDERAGDFYPDWEAAADVSVAILRTEAGRDPHDKDLHDLIGELSTRSDAFRTRWAAHNVRRHGSGTKNFHHHVAGDLTLTYEGLELTAEPGLSFLIYTAEPGSPSAERLALLASWVTPSEPLTEPQLIDTEKETKR
jgi:transcriptional regulator with XRE-family HTH domain